MSSDKNNQLEACPVKKRKYVSGKSLIPARVRFVNQTKRVVDIVWLNFEGIGVKYWTLGRSGLKQGKFVDVNTFAGHPWIFRDSETREKLSVYARGVSTEIFEPEGHSSDEEISLKRTVVNINIPVYTLKEICVQGVRQCMMDYHGQVDKKTITSLDIPSCLQEDLLLHPREPFTFLSSSHGN